MYLEIIAFISLYGRKKNKITLKYCIEVYLLHLLEQISCLKAFLKSKTYEYEIN